MIPRLRILGIGFTIGGIAAIWAFPTSLIGALLLIAGLLCIYYSYPEASG